MYEFEIVQDDPMVTCGERTECEMVEARPTVVCAPSRVVDPIVQVLIG